MGLVKMRVGLDQGVVESWETTRMEVTGQEEAEVVVLASHAVVLVIQEVGLVNQEMVIGLTGEFRVQKTKVETIQNQLWCKLKVPVLVE